jgi:hypothetical protein
VQLLRQIETDTLLPSPPQRIAEIRNFIRQNTSWRSPAHQQSICVEMIARRGQGRPGILILYCQNAGIIR